MGKPYLTVRPNEQFACDGVMQIVEMDGKKARLYSESGTLRRVVAINRPVVHVEITEGGVKKTMVVPIDEE